MTLRVHNLVTGELAGQPSTLFYNLGPRSDLDKLGLTPYGYRPSFEWPDGTTGPAVLQPVPIWYIEGAGRHILVDTSFDNLEELKRQREARGRIHYARREPEWELPAALAKVGLTPADIDVVVLTHLHFDHFGNTELFENATFVVQREEIALAFSPPPYALFYYHELAPHLIHIRDRLEVADKYWKLADGAELYRLGGHTPGSLGVLVQTAAGRVALAGDLVYDYQNWERNWPSSAFWNLKDLIAGYQWLRKNADIVLPNHDWRLWDLYPDGIVG